jgi:hypothetical protein
MISGGEKMKQELVEKSVPEFLKEYSVASNNVMYEESSLIKSLKGLRSYAPLPSEINEKNIYAENIVRQWFSQKMRSKYNELSPELLELKRRIEIEGIHLKDSDGRSCSSYKKFTVKMPLLLQAELDIDDGWSTEVEERESYETYKVTLFSRIPKVPFEVRKSGREALVFAYRTFADALDTKVLGDIISENPSYAPHPDSAKLVVLWKPKPSEIFAEAEVIDKDPALILNWDKPYLVSTWTEPEEEPFMHLINACRLINLDTFMGKKDKTLDTFLIP